MSYIERRKVPRAHQNVVIVALANKLVRMALAVLCKNESYRAPVLAVTT